MRTLATLTCVLALFSACGGGGRRATLRVPEPRPVSILVEVYDPVTDFVWENVSVRIVESWQEWSDAVYPSPYDDLYLTDATGRVLLDEYRIAYAEVGFVEDGAGRALLRAGSFENEASVLIEISAEGFVPVYVDVPLRWDEPDVFVEVPFQ